MSLPPPFDTEDHARGYYEGTNWQENLGLPHRWTGVFVRAFQLGSRCTGFVVPVDDDKKWENWEPGKRHRTEHEYIEMTDYWHGYVMGVSVVYNRNLKPAGSGRPARRIRED